MPRRTNPAQRLSRFGNRARRLSAAIAAATAPVALAAVAPAASATDGVVELSAGPGFGDAAPTWVEPAVGASYEASPGTSGSILPAGYVTPPAQFGPHGDAAVGPAGRLAPGGLYDPAVAPAQYGPPPAPAPYYPPEGFVSPGGPANFGGGPAIDYRVRGGRPEGPGSLWTTIARYAPPEGSFVRVEYLQYSLSGEEIGTVGAPIPGVTTFQTGTPADRFTPFGNTVFDEERNGGNFSLPGVTDDGTTYVVPGLQENEVDDFEGARITISRPIADIGRAEAYLTAFSQETFTIQPELPFNVAQAVGIGFKVNGDPSDPLIRVFNGSYEMEYETEMWGTGGRMYFDHIADPNGFGLRPLVGVRYLMLNQNMYQRGSFQTPTAMFDSEISTTVHNNLFGSELGVEAEYRHERFTLGVRPTISGGLNVAQVRTRTDGFAGPTEGARRHTDHYAEFSPVFDLAAYLRIPLGDSFKLSVGYDFLYLSNVAQPNESTNYNLTQVGAIPETDVKPKRSFDDVTFNGLSIGLEMLIP
ncbi:BBP7 family outer membrane beta-barrel protein [Alienimonas chondri]|uniref:Uncharacterized protein n=1 Tax=Alienimonas chondri TaxID=2681879 RepID=A0ABX1VGI8_9PLAN|nr:BBP7 family outer membrane beta-barrel protein [Alienimonas chondri]NNJ26884.1 hypothetical protein [Alienimonas chondri]